VPRLEEVFRLSGIPTYTFVEPDQYNEVKVSLRTPGRCLVIEGPSGIGKTTTVTKAISELGLASSLILSARQAEHVELIEELPTMKDIGTVIVDDFHRLPESTKNKLSDFMKVLADSSDEKSKLVLIGINEAGQQLVKFAHDLGMRIDVLKFEANSTDKIFDLIALGEQSLNVAIVARNAIASRAEGSFQIAQMLCHRACLKTGVDESGLDRKEVTISVDVIVEDAMVNLDRQFSEAALAFAQGSKLRREGRAPYLHILKWLADGTEWSLDLREEMNRHPQMKGSVGQVLDKGFLVALLEAKSELFEPYFHYEPTTSVLSVEDPKLIFYLKNLVWRAFSRRAGFRSDYFGSTYDFALSFAGPDRQIAERLSEILREREVEVFYDWNLQSLILGRDLEAYLGPIYRSEARYILPLLSKNYPKRIWTKFESEQFKERFGTNSVFAIRFVDAEGGWFDEDHKYGSLSFDPRGDVEHQLQEIANVLCDRLLKDREGSEAEEAN
jgi:hypothetical protein